MVSPIASSDLDGYLVIGDAVCSFNPIYGQGMSAAALEAQALGECLTAGDDGLADRFFRSGRVSRDRRRGVQLQSDLRSGDVGRRARGTGARGVSDGRRRWSRRSLLPIWTGIS